MKLILTLSFALFLSSSTKEHGVFGAPLSTKAPKSTKAPSSVPSISPSLSMSPSAAPACGGTCTGSQICMTTYQQEGTIGIGGVTYTAPLPDGTYRICPEGAGDCEVPNSWGLSGDTFACRVPESYFFVKENCIAADILGTISYACTEDENPTALGVYETFTCPGDDRCLTPAPSDSPSMGPTPKSAKAPKSATLNPTSVPTAYVDSCRNGCIAPEICTKTYQQEGVIMLEGTPGPQTPPLGTGNYRYCPSGSGDCEVPSFLRVTGGSQSCRAPGSFPNVLVDCADADAVGPETYACLDGVNPLAGGTAEYFSCPSTDSRCA